MQKHFKNFVVILCAVVFAFCPVFIAGCDLGDIGGGDSTSQGGNSKPSYDVNDYLSALKVAYTPAVNGTTDESINEYVNQVLGVTELMAVDTLVELMENYFDKSNYKYDSSLYTNLSFSSTNDYIALEDNIEISYNEKEYSSTNPISEMDASGTKATNKYIGFGKTITRGTYEEVMGDTTTRYYKWKVSNDFIYGTSGNFTQLSDYFIKGKTGSTLQTNSVAYKMMYAILSISNTFNNVTDDNFETAYASFTTDYDNAIKSNDLESKCRQLATITKHSGLVAGTSEAKAFKQYILDYIIGEDNVNRDNGMVWTYSNGSYKRVGDVYEGEYYYYNQDLQDLLDVINENSTDKYSYIDLLEIIAKGNKNEVDEDIIENLTVNSNGKLWQDFDGDNRLTKKDNNDTDDIVYATDKNGNNLKDGDGKNIPKYQVTDPEFRNYDWTVGKIVEKVLSTSEITYKNESGQESTITGYPTTSNVFSIDYAYNSVEISGSDMDAKYTCSLPRSAYKSILICAKDRTGKDIANNIGYINMVLESAEGVSVDVKIFARYYRTGLDYATWKDGYGDDKTLYPLVNVKNDDNSIKVETLTINGAYKLGYENGNFQDSSLEINVQEMFKSAQFGVKGADDTTTYVNNDKKFTFTYEDSEGVEQTKEIYEIEPFPDGFYNTSLKKAVHAQVFGVNGATNPTYKTINLPTGEVLYSYDPSNLTGVTDGYGYIEILFAPSNENAFTFGLLGYAPENESTF